MQRQIGTAIVFLKRARPCSSTTGSRSDIIFKSPFLPVENSTNMLSRVVRNATVAARWQSSVTGFKVQNPYTLETIAEIPFTDSKAAKNTVGAAAKAQEAWAEVRRMDTLFCHAQVDASPAPDRHCFMCDSISFKALHHASCSLRYCCVVYVIASLP